MNLEIAEKLHQLGFHLSKNGNSEYASWSQPFQVGNLKAVLCIREFGVGYQYRVLLANANKARDQEQWFDADEIMSAICGLLATRLMWKWSRREIEGKFVRSSWREIVSWWLLSGNRKWQPLGAANAEHGIRHAAGKGLN
jgi:hypothetical protein